MHTRFKLGDIVYTLKRNGDDNGNVNALVIVKGRMVDQDENGVPIHKWEGELIKNGEYIPANRIFATIRALFKYDPVAKRFARPDPEDERQSEEFP